MNYHVWKPHKLKPSSKFFAKARPARGGKGFNGQFAGPGLVPDLVSVNGRPAIFDTEDEAELAAYRALETVLNARLEMRMKFNRVQKMSAKELSDKLDKVDLTPTELGNILASERIMGFLDGTYEIPHFLTILMGLFESDPANIERAESIAESATLQRSDR